MSFGEIDPILSHGPQLPRRTDQVELSISVTLGRSCTQSFCLVPDSAGQEYVGRYKYLVQEEAESEDLCPPALDDHLPCRVPVRLEDAHVMGLAGRTVVRAL
ncbi:hypothetical protein BaRGS_00009299 [Batillaria attramentaria]|uniref:Uncharacterized protein n=1 Tax=Batillaria attramentaria TaxID=370345 RepID=A0ABD0LIF7_9CAEN